LLVFTRLNRAWFALFLIGIVAGGAVLSLSGVFAEPPSRTVSSRPENTYYGYVPTKIWRNVTRLSNLTGLAEYFIDPDSVTAMAELVIVGNSDATSVTVYELPKAEALGEFTVDKLEKVTVRLLNGTFFKVLSSKPATVMLSGGTGRGDAIARAGISTFFTSAEGGYVGKEFIFMAVQPEFPGENVGEDAALYHRVYALEDSDVTLQDADGVTVSSFRLEANKVKGFILKPLAVYRVVSTGNVMVQTFTTEANRARTVICPAVEGGFWGRRFQGSGSGDIWRYGGGAYSDRLFIFTGLDDAKLAFFNLEFKRKMGEETLPGGGNLSLDLRVDHVRVEADKPILMMFKSDESQDECGLAAAGLKGGQRALIYVPKGETYIFTEEESTVTVDDVQNRLPADGILPLWSGLHTVSASKNVVIQVMNLAPTQGFGTFGACLPSVQSLSISNDVKLKPVEEELPLTLIAGGAGVVAVAIVALLAVRRRGKRS